jgi:tRNA modification GTPase
VANCRALLDAPPFFDWFASPLRVALVGPPNAGKSSLANALSDRSASIVSAIAGTTRDWLEIPGEIQGYPVVWLDTAGLRRSADALEAASIERTHEVMAGADAILFVLDGSPEAHPVQREFARRYADDRPTCVAVNKSDCMASDAVLDAAERWKVPITMVSATERTGLDRLIESLLSEVGRDMATAGMVSPFTKRQTRLLRKAAQSDRERFRNLICECIGAI